MAKKMKKTMKRPTIVAAACSDKGRRRSNNEDNFCLNGVYMQREEMDEGGLFETQAQEDAIFAVCDGMGGEEAGEEASLLSVQLCARYLKDGEMSADRKRLETFFLDGCVSVMKQAERNGNRSGSTVAMVIADADGMHPANMGDSRIYRMTGGMLIQVSEDHTEMQRLLRRGEITPEEAKTHPRRHMIRQYWGMPLSIAPFSPFIGGAIPYVNGDRYLLCSDGLTDMLEDEEIGAILKNAKSVRDACRTLVDAALEHGGKDNVTVVVAQIEAEEEEEHSPTLMDRIKALLHIKGKGEADAQAQDKGETIGKQGEDAEDHDKTGEDEQGEGAQDKDEPA